MKHILIILAIIMMAVTAWAKPFNVLIIHSYQQEFPTTKEQHNGFVAGLKKTFPDAQYNIFTEYLNAKTSVSYAENTDALDNYIQSKYLLNKPDVIYATSDEAATYLSKTSLGYLRDVPLILSGITEALIIDRPGKTINIVIFHDIKKIIDTINKIFKNNPPVHIVGSDGKATWNICIDVERFIKKTGSKQTIETHIYKDIDNLLREVPKDEDAVYLIANAGGFFTSGRHETFKEALLKLTTKLGSKNILAMNEQYIQNGVLGGLVISDNLLGIQSGETAAKVLSGETEISFSKYATNRYVFDIKALNNAKITLPLEIHSRSKFLNIPPTFIEKYGNLLLWSTIILVIMIIITSISIAIFINNQHKQLTEAGKQLAEMSRKNQQYIDAVDASNLVSIADTKGRITYINDTYLEVTGYKREELLGKDHRILNHPDQDEKLYKSLIKTVTSGNIWLGVILSKTKDDKTIYLETSIVPLKDESGKILEYLSVRKDITQVIRQQKEIQSQYHDSLTGLPNRVKMRYDRNNSRMPAVALMNIDGFSIINTFYGMEAGDYLLKEVAEKIKSMLPLGMTVYRVSGDEFGILSPSTEDYTHFNAIILSILEKISFSTFIYEDNEMHFTMTSGTALGKNTTITRAGIALRQARLSKKSFMTYESAESEMEKIRDTVLQSGSLRYALINEKIVPFFQPIVDTETGEVHKYEALMRIEDQEGHILTPDKFLFMSKKLKLYNSLSMLMMETTLKQVKNTNHSVCLNFDIEDILNDAFQNKFFSLVTEYMLQGRITVEITESEDIDSLDELAAFLAKAKQHGCLIAIDDFGTGYSNFMYILSLQPDFLKLDGSITRQINVSPRAKLLTQTIADMCSKAGIKTVAEYVADEAIYKTIQEVGIDYCQGYLFGKPDPDFKIKLSNPHYSL